MPTHALPDFHKALLEPAIFPGAPAKVKFEETARSLLYRTGTHVYKVRKPSPIYSSPEICERYAQLALQLGRRWAGETVQAVVPIVRTAQGYALGGDGEPVGYALQLVQRTDARWLHRLLAQGKVDGETMGQLAAYLAARHAEAALKEKAAHAGHPEHIHGLVDEVAYQSKKYVGQTLSEPTLNMLARPLAKSFEELRKIFLRRQKRGCIVDGHGAFVPEHLHVEDGRVQAISALDAQAKYRVLDAANDVALLVNALTLREHGELAGQFLKRYVSESKDRDLPRVLPVYRALQALRCGLVRSEQRAELPADSKDRARLAQEAGQFYTLALQAAREMPKSA